MTTLHMRWPAIALVICALCGLADAGIVNGGFTTVDLQGWTTGGGGSPTPGVAEVVTSAPVLDPTGDFYDDVEGLDTSGEADGGYFANLLCNRGDVDVDVSLSQTFQAQAGEVLSFRYIGYVVAEGATEEAYPEGGEDNDLDASARISAHLYDSVGSQSVLFSFIVSAMGSGNEDFYTTGGGWTNISTTITQAGTYDLVFEADAMRMYGPNGTWSTAKAMIGVDNVQLVPEPATLGLLALGSVVALRCRRKA